MITFSYQTLSQNKNTYSLVINFAEQNIQVQKHGDIGQFSEPVARSRKSPEACGCCRYCEGVHFTECFSYVIVFGIGSKSTGRTFWLMLCLVWKITFILYGESNYHMQLRAQSVDFFTVHWLDDESCAHTYKIYVWMHPVTFDVLTWTRVCTL